MTAAASSFLRLRDALAAHLRAAPELAAVVLHVDSTRPIAQGETAAINLRLSDAHASSPVIEATDWRTTVFIDCAARGANADADADTLLSAVHASLASFAASAAARAIGVLEIFNDETTVEWDRDADDAPYTCASLRLTLIHRTPAGSLQPWGWQP